LERLLAAGLLDAPLDSTELITHIVGAVRDHLRMPFAFVSEFVDGDRVFRYVDSIREPWPFQVGDAGPLSESYCQRVVDGRLPPLIQDAMQLPTARELPVTASFPIGAHLSVPIVLAGGRVFGTFCCFSDQADHSLNPRDLEMMTTFVHVIARQIEREQYARQKHDEKRARVTQVMATDQMSVVFQPIRSLIDARLLGLEALARFASAVQMPPYLWFADAHEVGLGVELETLAIRKALLSLSCTNETYLALNASPTTVLSGELEAVLHDVPLKRIVVEITEHAQVDDYPALRHALSPLRRGGVRVAVDDAGAGYATLRHITELQPELIKLDAHLTTDLEHDPVKRGLVKAMTTFAGEIGCCLIAEGVETEQQKALLVELGIGHGQGYLLGRPATLGHEALLDAGSTR
jgi:EAL domain-containing protein (putative c-di-GMP-specific phosphodiesterase class I)